ncbi:MAG TPA: D-glycero-beta-D-manno-heptose-7-phosphate kinase [Candidatus Wallbacteria bacterium]|nr:D-glycero-beta-D-manno-heptose-7-phosphate kinase [Candidatus Wallbacteria bacterium]
MVIKKYIKERTSELESIFKKFSGVRMVIVGDVMIDEYLFGKCSRISPEAPVPVVEVSKREFRPGGAANVAKNVMSLGGSVSLCGIIGCDGIGRLACEEFEKLGIDSRAVFSDDARPTTLKTRIIAHNQQIARTDIESRHEVSEIIRGKIMKYFKDNLNKFDGVIISDYAKGLVSKSLLAELLPFLQKNKKIVTVDPKVANFYHYRGVTSITPNRKELSDVLGIPIETSEQLMAGGKSILHDLSLASLLVTLGEEGMCLFTGDGETFMIPTVARAVYDVTGAGDTVISSFTMALIAGADFPTAALISNFAAGEVVGMLGTSTVTCDQVFRAIKSFKK